MLARSAQSAAGDRGRAGARPARAVELGAREHGARLPGVVWRTPSTVESAGSPAGPHLAAERQREERAPDVGTSRYRTRPSLQPEVELDVGVVDVRGWHDMRGIAPARAHQPAIRLTAHAPRSRATSAWGSVANVEQLGTLQARSVRNREHALRREAEARAPVLTPCG
jgi:hypothetical protein